VQFDVTVPTLEDKVAQRAILLLLEPIYETDFLPCSYGFRPGRSAHDALHVLRNGFMEHGLRWVVDVDISKYFDTIDHAHLRRFLDQRVTDGVVRRMIDKWLKAGVLEKGVLRRTAGGTPPAREHLPAPCAGWVVRGRGATAAPWPMPVGSICR
jgi:RNA-directed DNA polymerase